MHVEQVADGARGDPLARPVDLLVVVPRIAHDDLPATLGGGAQQLAGVGAREHHRLLHQDVQIVLQGISGDVEVPGVRHGHDHSVEPLRPEHVAMVVVRGGRCEHLGGAAPVRVIRVRDGDQLGVGVRGDGGEVCPRRPPPGPDDSDPCGHDVLPWGDCSFGESRPRGCSVPGAGDDAGVVQAGGLGCRQPEALLQDLIGVLAEAGRGCRVVEGQPTEPQR